MANTSKALAGDLRHLVNHFRQQAANMPNVDTAYNDAAQKVEDVIKKHKLCPKAKRQETTT